MMAWAFWLTPDYVWLHWYLAVWMTSVQLVYWEGLIFILFFIFFTAITENFRKKKIRKKDIF